MLKIAICDDDKNVSSYIEAFVKPECIAQGIRAEIEVFSDGYYLLKSFEQGNNYNIVFLDIEMQKMDGIDTARKIREINHSSILIYVSSYDAYLKELFEVEPFRFISKPIDEKKLKQYFTEACQRFFNKNEGFFQFSFNKEIQRIPLKDIVYFESNNRAITVYLEDGTDAYFYGKLNEVENELKNSGHLFLRIHQSFYVNYNYVSKMNYSFLTVNWNNDEVDLKISEDRQKLVRNTIFDLAENKMTV
ncbi:MAG: LytTR family DNA-binding domain-containing protein [Pseudobutyrivibrio sp.]|nr:LytTR family DNA-binding domain-containing protein [Pseudobutyrivibrio sp.]